MRSSALLHAFASTSRARGFSRPFVYGMTKVLDEATFTYQTVPDLSQRHHLRFFTEGHPYRLLGLLPAKRRLFGVEDGYVALFGTDQLGMDIFSQTLYAGRISLSVGLVGVLISFVLGVVLGGISGYFGGRVDDLIQRTIEFLMSLPQLPLWIALSAAIPNNWTGIKTFFAITIILSVIGWTGLARVVRGRLIAMREEDYVMAAKVAGTGSAAIIGGHLLPGFLSYLVVSITLAVPYMILGETTLSFLGLGILPPEVRLGLADAGCQEPHGDLRLPMAPDTDHLHRHSRAVVQFHRRWTARCRGPLFDALKAKQENAASPAEPRHFHHLGR